MKKSPKGSIPFWTSMPQRLLMVFIFGLLTWVPVFAQTKKKKPHGHWVFVKHTVTPKTSFQKKYAFLKGGVAKSYVISDGSQVRGRGFAWDVSPGDDVLSISVAEGLETWIYKYVGKGSGEVELDTKVKIQGKAILMDPDATAAALGFAEVTSNVLPNPLIAKLTTSIASTDSEVLGDFKTGLKASSSTSPSESGTVQGYILT